MVTLNVEMSDADVVHWHWLKKHLWCGGRNGDAVDDAAGGMQLVDDFVLWMAFGRAALH